MNNELLVNEIYKSLTFQGEGQSVGKLCTFIRLFACNLGCVWCDSAFTWRFSENQPHNFAPVYNKEEEHRKMTVEQILEEVVPLNPPMIIISGGEPMLQARNLPKLINDLYFKVDALKRVEIETAGTIYDDRVASFDYVFFNVSPKLESSGNPLNLRYKPQVLKSFLETGRATFKFVICNYQDLEEVDQIVKKIGIPEEKVYIMVEGISEEVQKARMQEFADEIIKRRYNFSPRLHVLIWGNTRGK